MKTLIVIITLLLCNFAVAQRGSVKGYVKDFENNALQGVTVIVKPIKKGAYTNYNGKFVLKSLPYGVYKLQISYVGYETINKKITVNKPLLTLNIQLSEQIENLEEVIVSHSKVKQIKQRQSLNIEVVNKDFIHQNLSGSLMKSLEKLPGVSTISIGSGQSKPIIRGLSFNRVLVADKGLKHEAQQWGADHGLEIDQYAVKNLKVIKGPASLAYGSDAIGGVVDIKENTFPDKNSFTGEINSSYMSNNESFSGSLSLRKRFDKFFVKARVTNIKYSDYKVPANFVNVYSFQVPLHKNHLRNTAGKEQNYHLTAGYITDKMNFVFYGSIYKAKSGFFANAHGLEPRRVDNSFYDKFNSDIDKPLQDVNHYKLINKTTLYFKNHTLSLTAGVQQNIRSEKGRYVNHGYMPDVFPKDLGISKDLERGFNKRYYALKITDRFSVKKHNLLLGLDSDYQKNSIDGWGFIIPGFNQFSAGVFAIDQYKLSNKTTLTAGIRYDFGNIQIKKYVDWFASKDNNNQNVYLQRVEDLGKNFSNISFSLGFNYHKKHFNFKTNIGNSFRMPIAKELAANGVNYHYFRYEKGNKDLNPERSYQLDFVTEWNFKNWAVQISPFVNYFPNYIYLNPTASFDYLYGAGNQVFNYQQSSVFRYGGEIHAHINLLKHLRIGGVLEFVKSRQLSGDKKGFGLPFSPPFSVLINPKYSFNSKGMFFNPYIGLNYRITATQRDIVPPEEITKGYQLLNFNFGSSLKLNNYLVDINAQLQNIFNAKYFNHTNFYRLINLPEQGRNIVISVNLTF